MQCHLIHGSNVAQDLQDVLDDDDLAVILNSKDRPRCITEFISQSIQLLSMEETKRSILVIPTWTLGYIQ